MGAERPYGNPCGKCGPSTTFGRNDRTPYRGSNTRQDAMCDQVPAHDGRVERSTRPRGAARLAGAVTPECIGSAGWELNSGRTDDGTNGSCEAQAVIPSVRMRCKRGISMLQTTPAAEVIEEDLGSVSNRCCAAAPATRSRCSILLATSRSAAFDLRADVRGGTTMLAPRPAENLSAAMGFRS